MTKKLYVYFLVKHFEEYPPFHQPFRCINATGLLYLLLIQLFAIRTSHCFLFTCPGSFAYLTASYLHTLRLSFINVFVHNYRYSVSVAVLAQGVYA